MSRFPQLTETFILREMSSLPQDEWDVELFPLIIQDEGIIHDEASVWSQRAHAPSWSSIIGANFKLVLSRPLLYIQSFLRTIIGNFASPKFLIRSIYLFPKVVWMAEQMRKINVKHIHAHFATHPAFAAWLINQITGISYSVTVHAHDIFVNKTMLRQKIENACKVVAISEFNRRYLDDFLGGDVKEKTSVIRCGIEPEKYSLKNREDGVALRNPLKILCIGSLQPYKGISYLIDACAILRDKGVNFRCQVIGKGELQSELQNRIAKKGLGEFVILLGPRKQDEVAKLLSEADCYVQPSVITNTGKMEGIPVAIMEAMAAGLPVIASNLSGIPELVKHQQTGLLVAPADSEALADAILKIGEAPDFASKLSEQGREWVLTEFDLKKNVLKLSHLFKAILE